MMGLLIALAKSLEKGFWVEGLEAGIRSIFSIYENFETEKGGILFWPGQLPLEDYLTGSCPEHLLHQASSWCYGNIGIARGLEKVSKAVGWHEKERKYQKALEAILCQDMDGYFLRSPSLCHGYGSILMMRCLACREDSQQESLLSQRAEENIRKILEVVQENNAYIQKHPEVLDDQDHYREGYKKDFSLLQGVLGIGLCFNQVLHGDSSYTRLLLMD